MSNPGIRRQQSSACSTSLDEDLAAETLSTSLNKQRCSTEGRAEIVLDEQISSVPEHTNSSTDSVLAQMSLAELRAETVSTSDPEVASAAMKELLARFE